MINAYRILSVDSKATTDEIDDAFEIAVTSAKEKYSEKPSSLEAALDDLKDARRILLDENSRRALDEELQANETRKGPQSNVIDSAIKFYEAKMFYECMVTCDKILVEDPSNTVAKNLRNLAHKETLKVDINEGIRVAALKKKGYSPAQIATEMKGPIPNQKRIPQKKPRRNIGLFGFVSRNFFKLLITGAAIYAFFTIDALIPLRYDLNLMSGAEKAKYEAQVASRKKADRAKREANYQKRLKEYEAYNNSWYWCQLQLVLSSGSPGKVTTRDKIRECGPIPKKPSR